MTEGTEDGLVFPDPWSVYFNWTFTSIKPKLTIVKIAHYLVWFMPFSVTCDRRNIKHMIQHLNNVTLHPSVLGHAGW